MKLHQDLKLYLKGNSTYELWAAWIMMAPILVLAAYLVFSVTFKKELLMPKLSARDMYTSRLIEYPADKATLVYDFNFTKNGEWFYIISSNNKDLLVKSCSSVVEAQGEKWRVVEAKTGTVVANN